MFGTYAPILRKSDNMLSQQMIESCNCELEDGDRSLSLIQSNSVGNYNNRFDHECLAVTPSLFTDTTSLSATCPLPARRVVATDFVFGCFSQSTACIATRFGECSSTLLDKLWYTYSYIYKPTPVVVHGDNVLGSPTSPAIHCELESLHASPFRLLAILKPTTPFISIPLCTTSSTSHLLAFL